MVTCTQCQHTQEDGNFCEKCGGPTSQQPTSENLAQEAPNLKQATPQVEEGYQAQSQPSAQQGQQVEQIKQQSKQYYDYFLEILKNPTVALKHGDHAFINSIITLILFALSLSLSIYFIAKNAMEFAYVTDAFPFFPLVSRLLFGFLLIIAIGLVSAFIVLKIGKHLIPFKKLTAQFGGLAVPYTALAIVTMVISLLGSMSFSMIMIALSILGLSIIIVVNPLILSFYHLEKRQSGGQLYYLTILCMVITYVFIYLLSDIFISDFIQNIEGMMPMMW